MKKWLEIIMLSFIYAGVITFAQTFIVAYLNNGTVLVNINAHGEKDIELFFVIMSIVGVLYVTWKELYDDPRMDK